MKKIIVFTLFLIIALITVILHFHEKQIKGCSPINPRSFGKLMLYEDTSDASFKYYKPVTNFEENQLKPNFSREVNLNPLNSTLMKKFEDTLLFVGEYKSKNDNLKKQHLQLQYLSTKRNFIIFSALEISNPKDFIFDDYKDLCSNPISKIPSKNSMITEIQNNTNKAICYDYYLYDENDNALSLMTTVAGIELFSYKNGILYHLAALPYPPDTHEDLITAFKKFMKE